jgi:hypothetical protein
MQLTIEDAIARRDQGIARAGDHAGDRWKRSARGYLLEFLSSPRLEFLAEDVREFAEGRGIESPPDGRAWGAVMRSAQRDGLICAVGAARAKSSNLSYKVLWRAIPRTNHFPDAPAADCKPSPVVSSDASYA